MPTAFPTRRLCGALAEAHISRKSFSAVYGISTNYLNRILHGYLRVGPITVTRLRCAFALLGIDLHVLISLNPTKDWTEAAVQLELPFDRIDSNVGTASREILITSSKTTPGSGPTINTDFSPTIHTPGIRPRSWPADNKSLVCPCCGTQAPTIKAINRDFDWTCSHCGYAAYGEVK